MGIADTHLSHPTDSHPALGARLQSLGVQLSEVGADALDVSPADSAFSFFDNAEQYEEDISAKFQMYIAQRLGIDMPATDEGGDSGAIDPVQAIG